jgi:hypothetical protein
MRQRLMAHRYETRETHGLEAEKRNASGYHSEQGRPIFLDAARYAVALPVVIGKSVHVLRAVQK